MSETVTGVVGDYLKKGLAVSVQGRSGEQVAAIVEKISPDSIWLKLQSRSSDPAFTQEDKVQINYWDEGATIYSWVASVLEIDVATPKPLGLSVSKEIQIQRRKSYRARARVPFSFTVIEAATSDLVGDRIRKNVTENITAGGLLFRDDLALEVGDRLALPLHLPSSQPVEAAAWVVRSGWSGKTLFALDRPEIPCTTNTKTNRPAGFSEILL
jgi:c-di-GMP-binding flagellar brake protein YcgR